MAKPTPAAPKPVPISLDAIVVDGRTQSRMRTDPEVVEQYAENWREGVEFPPVELFLDEHGLYYIGDGIHRVLGAKAAGRSSILAIVHKGTERDARMFACAANRNHGLHRSNADKRRAAEIMLELEPQWTNVRIAQHCGISDELVREVRRVLEGAKVISPAPVREGSDGKTQKVTSKPKAPPAQGPEIGPCASPPIEPDDFDTVALEAEKPAVDIESLADWHRRAVNDINRIIREAKAAAADEKYGAYMADQVVRLTTDGEAWKSTIRMAEPVAICADCKGAGCRRCQKTGYITRLLQESRKTV